LRIMPPPLNQRRGITFFTQAAPFVSSFVEELNMALEKHKPGCGLSRTQRGWISFCVMAIIVTNSVCWARFERAGPGMYSLAALSWIFRHSKIPWELLLSLSVRVVLGRHGIKEGSLVEPTFRIPSVGILEYCAQFANFSRKNREVVKCRSNMRAKSWITSGWWRGCMTNWVLER